MQINKSKRISCIKNYFILKQEQKESPPGVYIAIGSAVD